jgi:hypothetical protein
MLVRPIAGRLRLIRQFDHSLAAGRIATEWSWGTNGSVPGEAPGLPARDLLAIALHDLAWARRDVEPVLDPASGTVESFRTLSLPQRLALYREGLDRQERIDPYATLLASLHYARFVTENEDATFVAAEAARRSRLASQLGMDPRDPGLEERRAWLMHFDDLSLLACLGPPGEPGLPSWLTLDRASVTPGGRRHDLAMPSAGVIECAPFPFRRPFRLRIPCRDIPDRVYGSPEGLRAAWAAASPGVHEVVCRSA